ncbi:unnamed protein product [Bursaphelenchus okinawaensis]|uniref:Uncharacterized protein n=1 Tax=Bursaphelenchus okinawaensis TaxID=465554 RepID=A0A811K7D0_9BILA|nr:unnamed protein product [Bursaphelenchus okinawaensis]CAG9094830.1 unnamed protein product [Bursaphelenchus okinawaensis]
MDGEDVDEGQVKSYLHSRYGEGVVVVATNDGEISNELYEFGRFSDDIRTVTLGKSVYIQYRPKSGRHRNAPTFPVGTRLKYERIGRKIVKYEVTGTYNFTFARGVRGIEGNVELCFVDLLELVLPLNGKAYMVPPGVSFHLTVGFRLWPTQVKFSKIEFYVDTVHRVSFESISFDEIPWPIHGIITYQPLPDYNKKYEPLASLPFTYLVYIGQYYFIGHRFKEVLLVRLGPHMVDVELQLGQFYVSQVVQSRLDAKNYTFKHIRPYCVQDQKLMPIVLQTVHDDVCRIIDQSLPKPDYLHNH